MTGPASGAISMVPLSRVSSGSNACATASSSTSSILPDWIRATTWSSASDSEPKVSADARLRAAITSVCRVGSLRVACTRVAAMRATTALNSGLLRLAARACAISWLTLAAQAFARHCASNAVSWSWVRVKAAGAVCAITRLDGVTRAAESSSTEIIRMVILLTVGFLGLFLPKFPILQGESGGI